jgi:zinc/manganese transport system substrate-binding protein
MTAAPPLRAAAVAVTIALAGLALGGCATTAPVSANPSGTIAVVAAENFWGSIAGQLGGSHAQVTSIITNPNTDPHDYEASPADGRLMARAQLVIDNGVGYDPWAPKLLAADPDPKRTELTVGTLVGVPQGGNPHRWYSPADVHRVIGRITADYQRLDPADAGYFATRQRDFENTALAGYDRLIGAIKAKYAGTPIGASESIISPLAEGLGLRMLTPESFLDAISEGSDPTAADKTTIDTQISTRQIKVYVQAQVAEARAAGIPVVTVTETLAPANATFQDWQVKQLQGIEAALHQATGK